MDIVGRADVPISLGKTTVHFPVLVTSTLTQPCLLGADFLQNQGCVINLQDQTLDINGELIHMLPQTSSAASSFATCHVTIAETIIIPGLHQMQVAARVVDVHMNRKVGMIEPLCSFMEKNSLLVAHSMSICENGYTLICILNPSTAPVTIYDNEYVAQFSVGALCTEEVCAVTKRHHQKSNPQTIAHHLGSQPHLSVTETGWFDAFLQEYAEVFSLSEGDIDRTSLAKHEIHLEDFVAPIKQQYRRVPYYQRHEMKQMIEKMILQDVIEPSFGPWSSPVVLVKKKDGSSRFCVDFRKLNSITKKDAQPIPRIDDTLETLAGSCYFSTLDLASGYWQVPVEESDRSKTAFSTPFGLYQFKVMPFGLCNAPATFQRLMEKVLSGLHWSMALVYLDDIIVFSRTVDEHFQRLHKVFRALKQAGLKVKAKKCHLFQNKVRYLGYIISSDGIATDPDKITSITRWPVPANVKEVRQFLGLSSYYRKFIQSFAQIAASLFQLTESKRHWAWSEKCQESFQSLKDCLTQPPILSFPQFNLQFILDVDASGEGIGAVLSQVDPVNQQETVIAYASRVLTKQERKYCTTRRELLALVWGVRYFRPYLFGKAFIARTDHRSLNWLKSFREPEGQLARWLQILEQYDLQVVHRPGKRHLNADALSRGPCHQCGYTEPATVTCAAPLDTPSWLPQWSSPSLAGEQAQDPDLNQIIAWLKTDTMPTKFSSGYSHTIQALWAQRHSLVIAKEILSREWHDIRNNGAEKHLQMVLPKQLKEYILRQLHDHQLSGAHLGQEKTFQKIQQRFYWVGQRKDIREWCEKCMDCASRKSPKRKRRGSMGTIKAVYPFQIIAMDILGPLPSTKLGNKYVLVIGDYFTKWTEAYPMPDMEAVTVAGILVNQFICRFGTPEQIHTDQGRNFESILFQELCQMMDVRKTRTTPYHPQSDGMIERFNRTLLSLISINITDHQDNWDDLLPKVMFAYRSSVHESTKKTPYSLVFGREVKLPIDIVFGLPSPKDNTCKSKYVLELRRQLENSYEFVREKLKTSQERQKVIYDRRRDGKYFEQGDLVWLNRPFVPKGISRKLFRPWQGPFKIVKVISDVVYRVERSLPQSRRRQRFVVHFDRLKPFNGHGDFTTSELPAPPPNRPAAHVVVDEDHDLYTVHPSDGVELNRMQPRRSTRVTRPPERYGDLVYY